MEDYVGKICPYCKTEIKEGDAVKVCPECGIPHHESCWKENHGCTTFGCPGNGSEEQHEEQSAQPQDVCANCGTPLKEGQNFCPKCGSPRSAPKKNVCSRCGAELKDGQEFCPKCGQKVGLELDAGVSEAIGQFNANVGAQKKKKSTKRILAIAIPAELIVIGIVVFILTSGSFGGKYVLVSGTDDSNSEEYYDFEDDYYICKSSDDTERGSYTVEKDRITLVDDDGDRNVLYRDGDYIFESEIHYNEKLQDGDRVNQKLTKSRTGTYEGYTIEAYVELQLKSDGTYSYTLGLTYGGYEVSDPYTEKGTYTRSGNTLKLHQDSDGHDMTYIVKDGTVYDDVYMKEK